MSHIASALKIVHRMMYQKDSFSKWMDIQIVDVGLGNCILKADIRADMLNGFEICHGGVTYSLADSALAFASNSHGIQSVSVETSMSHIKKVILGDVITAVASEKSLSAKFGIYDVTLTNQNDELVGVMKGTVYRTGKPWEI